MDEAIDLASTVVLNADDLKKGMYVAYLDRPWLDTQFPFCGFEIQSDQELAQLRESCEYVFVQTDRGSHPDGYQRFMEESTRRSGRVEGLAEWDVSVSTEDEFRTASAAVDAFRGAVVRVFTAAARRQALDLDGLSEAAGPLRDSIERCPDAALYAVHTTDDVDYLYRHAVACGVMGMIMGRALGLPRKAPLNLAVGCALLDVGKTQVPQELLNRPNNVALSPDEMGQLRAHVRHSVDLVARDPESKKAFHTMIAYHHERHNGHGYPEGYVGHKIPLPGRIAGIVDFYDAMISQRAYGRRATPNEAMRYIRQRRGEDFCPQLVDQFLEMFRPYPTGSLVELSDGSVGRVIQQHPTGRLTPRVHVILGANKKRIHEFRVVDLLPTVGADSLCIQACLKPGRYGVGV